METLGAQLRKAREAQGYSIDTIEEMTLINARHLLAIERGATDTLPRPYIRAFIREYAAVLGLDPAELLKQMDDRERAVEAQRPPPAVQPREISPLAPAAEQVASRMLSSNQLRIAGVATVLVAAAVALVVLNDRSPVPDVREIPFGDVIRENERKAAPAQQPAAATPAPQPAAGDSILLAALVSDTLWMQIVIDDAPPREYLARPGFRASWKAGGRFLVTLGNAGAATWTLNGKQLGTLGRPGAVARNIELNRRSLASR